MNAQHTAQTATAAIVDAFRGEAAAAQGYVLAYVESAAAIANGATAGEIAKGVKASGIKAGADLVGDFALTAPLVADGGFAASAWVRDKFGADSMKRTHTLVTAARIAKGQGKPVVRSLTAPLVDMLAAEDFDMTIPESQDAYAAAVARALSALSKVKPVKDETPEGETDETPEVDDETPEDEADPFLAALDMLANAVTKMVHARPFITTEERDMLAQVLNPLHVAMRDAIREDAA